MGGNLAAGRRHGARDVDRIRDELDASGVVLVLVAHDEAVDPADALRAQVGQQRDTGRDRAAAPARSGVEHERVFRGLDNRRQALADVDHGERESARHHPFRATAGERDEQHGSGRAETSQGDEQRTEPEHARAGHEHARLQRRCKTRCRPVGDGGKDGPGAIQNDTERLPHRRRSCGRDHRNRRSEQHRRQDQEAEHRDGDGIGKRRDE